MARILVVEDEVDLGNVIRTHLESEGHIVHQAFDGPSALALVDQQRPELLILDLMLPGLDGLAVCRRIRTRHLMPILMLTARSEEADRVLGLEVGADDYVVKPFSMRELMARVRALLRRIEMDSQASAHDELSATPIPVVHGPLRVDPAARTATLDSAELELTPKEFDLLLLFASHPGRAFSRNFLVRRLWSDEFEGMDRTVDTHIMRLRKKLGAFGERIATVWGVGYRFEP
jgi:DNA-binding response OmpR family regulator